MNVGLNVTYSYQVDAVDPGGRRSAKSNTAAITCGSTATLIFDPTADTYVQGDMTSTNYGLNAALKADASPVTEAYLRFNLQGLAGSVVSSAALRLYTNSASSIGFSVHALTGSWDELTTTYSSRPTAGSQAGTSNGYAKNAWVQAGVLPLVTGDGQLNLAVKTTSNTSLSYSSRGAAAPPNSSSTSPPTPRRQSHPDEYANANEYTDANGCTEQIRQQTRRCPPTRPPRRLRRPPLAHQPAPPRARQLARQPTRRRQRIRQLPCRPPQTRQQARQPTRRRARQPTHRRARQLTRRLPYRPLQPRQPTRQQVRQPTHQRIRQLPYRPLPPGNRHANEHANEYANGNEHAAAYCHGHRCHDGHPRAGRDPHLHADRRSYETQAAPPPTMVRRPSCASTAAPTSAAICASMCRASRRLSRGPRCVSTPPTAAPPSGCTH